MKTDQFCTLFQKKFKFLERKVGGELATAGQSLVDTAFELGCNSKHFPLAVLAIPIESRIEPNCSDSDNERLYR
jgi:hypothetical protein